MKDSVLSSNLTSQQMIDAGDILSCDSITQRFGLSLSYQDVTALAQTRQEALVSCGRIEIDSGIIKKMILKFCSSPYIDQDNYLETLNDLLRVFYYFKNESLDLLTDDELLEFMKSSYDGECQGSIELMQSKDLEIISKNIRSGHLKRGINYNNNDSTD